MAGRPAPDGARASGYSSPLVALGAETVPEKPAREGRILIRFDLMRGHRVSDSDEPWADAGALWLEPDNELRVRGRGLTVYPTSAPSATVGGWPKTASGSVPSCTAG